MIIMIIAYVFSVVIGWFAGRSMERDSRKAGEEPLPCIIAIFLTFFPVVNVVIGMIVFIINCSRKFELFSSSTFYLLDE